jgi:hypothetical protein
MGAGWENPPGLPDVTVETSRDRVFTALTDSGSYVLTGRNDDAPKLREEVLTLSRKVLGRDNPDTLDAMNILADADAEVGRNKEASDFPEPFIH